MMTKEIIIFVILIILFPLVYYYGRYSKSSVIDKPLILHSVVIQFAFNAIILLFVGLSVYLLILNWKLLLIFIGIMAILGYISGLYLKRKHIL